MKRFVATSLVSISMFIGVLLGNSLAGQRKPKVKVRYPVVLQRYIGSEHIERSVGTIIEPDWPILCSLSGQENGWDYDPFLDQFNVYWNDQCSFGNSSPCHKCTIIDLYKYKSSGNGGFILTFIAEYCTGGVIQCNTSGTDHVWLTNIKGSDGAGTYVAHCYFYWSDCPGLGSAIAQQQVTFDVN